MPSAGKRADRKEISYRLYDLTQKFLAQMKAEGRSPLTMHVYERIISDLRDFLAENQVEDDARMINKKLIERYADHVWKDFDLERNGKIEWLARLQIFFRRLSVGKVILADPTATMNLPKSKRRKYPPYLTQQEMAKLLDCIATNTPEGLRDRALLELLYSCGLRSSEMCRLAAADINFTEGILRILQSKGKKDRMTPVGKTALHYLGRYLEQVRGLNLSGPLFYFMSTGTALQTWMINVAIKKYAKKARIRKAVSARIFRHCFAIHLLENGASIRHIQAMMGHECLTTTQKYTNVVPTELKRAHMKAHPSERRRQSLPSPAPQLKRIRRLPPSLTRGKNRIPEK